jgi:DNA polymerase-3 subunit delta'
MNVITLHEKTWAALQARRAQLPHALMLIGERGLGKFELARQFAASLLCEQPQSSGIACGKCLACNWFAQGNHPDFRLLQPDALSDEPSEAEDGKKKASQQITIDQVRGLDDFLNVGTHRAGLRVILINPTEAMNRSTANALLKSLEEPAAGTLFLLISSEPLRLLPTLRSRCQVVPISLPSMAVAARELAEAGIENPERWLALAGGAPGLAIELAASGQAVWLDLLLKRIAAGREIDPIGLAAELEKLLKESKGKLLLKSIVEVFQKWLVDLNLARNALPVRYFVQQQGTSSALAAMIPATRLLHAYRALLTRRREAEQPLNTRLFLESLFLDYRALFAK